MPGNQFSRYGISLVGDLEPAHIRDLEDALFKLPEKLVQDCQIKSLGFEDLGPSAEFYPNHGYYVDRTKTLMLNSQLKNDPHVYQDDTGATMDRFEQTLYHELGHGFDHANGDLSSQKEWLELSGWSENPKKGLHKIVIEESGSPKVDGEWYYDASAGFPRYYAKRNPWDDFADSFSFYVAGTKSFLPRNKVQYFDTKLAPFYSKKASHGGSMHIISRALNDLAGELKSMGSIKLAQEMYSVSDGIRIAEEDPDIEKNLGKILQEKDKNGIPVLYYLLNTKELTPEIERKMKSLAPNALKTQVTLERALQLCRSASRDINILAGENSADDYVFKQLNKLSVYASSGEKSLGVRLRRALTPTQIELKKQELLPKQVGHHIDDLKNQAQVLLRSKGKEGIGDFMRTFKSIMDIKHKIEHPRDPVVRTPVGPMKEDAINPQVYKLKKDIGKKPVQETKKQTLKEKALEKGKKVLDIFKKKPKEDRAEVKLTPDRPVKEKSTEKVKKDITPDRPSKKEPPMREKSEEKKTEKDDWEKKKKEKMKGTKWETGYTWEDFSKLSSEDRQEIVNHFDSVADRLSGFGQVEAARLLDEISNEIQIVEDRS